MKSYIYRMKREMYLAISRKPGEKILNREEMIEHINNTFHLCVEITDIQFD